MRCTIALPEMRRLLTFLLIADLPLGACGSDGTRPGSVACVAPSCIAKAVFIPLETQVRSAAADGGDAPDAASFAGSEPVWFTRSTIVAQTPPGDATLSTEYATWRPIRWEITQDFLIARAIADAGGAPIEPSAQPAMMAFRVLFHLDPAHQSYCPTIGYSYNCDADISWMDLPAIRLDLSQGLTTETILIDRAGAALLSEPVPVYINAPMDPNAPVAHCGDEICADTRTGVPLLTDFAATLRLVFANVEVTIRTEFARTPH